MLEHKARAVPRIWRPLNKINDEALKFEKIKAYFHLIIKLQNIYGSYNTKNRSNLNAKSSSGSRGCPPSTVDVFNT
jgi:hypothetical protein